MPPIPDKPRAKRSYRKNAAAAQRRIAAGQLTTPGPHKGQLTPLAETERVKAPAVKPGTPTQRRQPSSGSPLLAQRARAEAQRRVTPGQVLGATPGVSNTSYLPGTKVNPRQAPGPGAGLGGAFPGAERAGKRFHVGYTADGRIVHMYGSDVPAAQRRQVLAKKKR